MKSYHHHFYQQYYNPTKMMTTHHKSTIDISSWKCLLLWDAQLMELFWSGNKILADGKIFYFCKQSHPRMKSYHHYCHQQYYNPTKMMTTQHHHKSTIDISSWKCLQLWDSQVMGSLWVEMKSLQMTVKGSSVAFSSWNIFKFLVATTGAACWSIIFSA